MVFFTWLRERLGLADAVFLRIPLEGVRGELYASPMPYGPYDKLNQLLRRYQAAGIQIAVPLVTDEEMKRKLKRDLLAAYARAGIEVIRLPITDLTSPALGDVRAFVDTVEPRLRDGGKIAVHCNAGTGRTAVVSACLASRLLQLDGRDATRYIESLMATQITASQKQVVERFGDQTQAATSKA